MIDGTRICENCDRVRRIRRIPTSEKTRSTALVSGAYATNINTREHDSNNEEKMTAPEGAGPLRRVRPDHSLWNVDDDHGLVGHDRQPYAVHPTADVDHKDHLTSHRDGSGLAERLERYKMTKSTATATATQSRETMAKAITMECLGNSTELVRVSVWAPHLSMEKKEELEDMLEDFVRRLWLDLSDPDSACLG